MEFIPAGFNCTAAWVLKTKNLRKKAFPFDWIITPSDAFLYLSSLSFDFDLLSFGDLEALPPCRRLLFDRAQNEILTEDLVTPIINKRLKILFPHDFSSDWKSDYPVVHDRYLRRMKRLRSTIKSGARITFVSSHPRFTLFPGKRLNAWQRQQFEQVSVHSKDLRFKHKDIKKAVDNMQQPTITAIHLSDLDSVTDRLRSLHLREND